MRNVNWNTYLLVLAITAFIFGSAFLLSEFFYQKRVSQVQEIEQQLNLNVLATEVDYAILSDAICDSQANTLTEELGNLADRLSYMEDQRGAKDTEVINLKKYYSLLQIKDYLLLKQKMQQCNVHPPVILYFYSNSGNCADCTRQGYVLTGLHKDFPDLHVYAFDYDLDLSAIRTLKSVYRLNGELPALVVNRIPYYGFHDRKQVMNLLPALGTSATTTAATSTR